MPNPRSPADNGLAATPRNVPPGDAHGLYDFSSSERHNKRSFNDETYSPDALLGALTELLAPLLRAALADEDTDESTP